MISKEKLDKLTSDLEINKEKFETSLRKVSLEYNLTSEQVVEKILEKIDRELEQSKAIDLLYRI